MCHLLLSVVSATGEGVTGACFESSFIPEYSLCHDDWWSDGLMEQGRLSSQCLFSMGYSCKQRFTGQPALGPGSILTLEAVLEPMDRDCIRYILGLR